MTVLEPTPDAPRERAATLRRLSFAVAALALVATFAFALSGIASTQGTLSPDGQAAALASHGDARSNASEHRNCRRGGQRARGTSGRV